MTYYLAVFLAGFAGSFHCLGMCGGFACALGSDRSGRGPAAWLGRHLLYNVGRVTSYAFLGALAGTAAGALALALTGTLDAQLVAGQQILTVAAGALMIVMALQFFGLLHRGHAGALGFGGLALTGAMQHLLRAPGPAAPLALGVVNGFLPCPLVYAFVAQAATSGAPLPAILTMVAFGLGTFPAMLFMGGAGRLLQPVWRKRGVRIAGAFLLALGLVTLLRGALPMTTGFALPSALCLTDPAGLGGGQFTSWQP